MKKINEFKSNYIPKSIADEINSVIKQMVEISESMKRDVEQFEFLKKKTDEISRNY